MKCISGFWLPIAQRACAWVPRLNIARPSGLHYSLSRSRLIVECWTLNAAYVGVRCCLSGSIERVWSDQFSNLWINVHKFLWQDGQSIKWNPLNEGSGGILGGGDSRVVASRISKQEPKRARVRFPVGAKKFSDGTCKYLPFVELLLC